MFCVKYLQEYNLKVLLHKNHFLEILSHCSLDVHIIFSTAGELEMRQKLAY